MDCRPFARPRRSSMPPFVIPPLVKFTLGAIGGAVVIRWAIKEVRRINAELDRVKAASDDRSGRARTLPTLRPRPANRRVAAVAGVRQRLPKSGGTSTPPAAAAHGRARRSPRRRRRKRSPAVSSSMAPSKIRVPTVRRAKARSGSCTRARRRKFCDSLKSLYRHVNSAVPYSPLMPFSRISLPQRTISSCR